MTTTANPATTEAHDRALIRLAKQDDPAAIAELVRRQLEPGAGKLWRLPSVVRLRTADEYVGAIVDVDIDAYRDGTRIQTVTARLVSSAYGGTSGAIVLRFPVEANRRDRLVELARVAAIRRARVSAALAATYPR